MPCRGQQQVLLPGRHIEAFGQVEDHLLAGAGPSALDEADVPLVVSGEGEGAIRHCVDNSGNSWDET